MGICCSTTTIENQIVMEKKHLKIKSNLKQLGVQSAEIKDIFEEGKNILMKLENFRAVLIDQKESLIRENVKKGMKLGTARAEVGYHNLQTRISKS